MKNEISFISEPELKQFETSLKNTREFKDTEVDKATLVILYKLYEIERRVAKVEKHLFASIIPPEG